MVKEACVDNFQDAVNAIINGADRLELCSSLDQDGLTPKLDLFKKIKEEFEIPLRVMIRPRGGGFVYTESEIQLMKNSIEEFIPHEPDGFVFGIKNKENHLDVNVINELILFATPFHCVIHKAIDSCSDIIGELNSLKKLQTPLSILSSGGATTALEGLSTLQQMCDEKGAVITIIAAGNITRKNLIGLSSVLNTDEFHGRRIVS